MLRLHQPCFPTRAPKPPTGDNWVHEIKHDGFRMVARRVGGVRLQPNTATEAHGIAINDYAERYQPIVPAIPSRCCRPCRFAADRSLSLVACRLNDLLNLREEHLQPASVHHQRDQHWVHFGFPLPRTAMR